MKVELSAAHILNELKLSDAYNDIHFLHQKDNYKQSFFLEIERYVEHRSFFLNDRELSATNFS